MDQDIDFDREPTKSARKVRMKIFRAVSSENTLGVY